ncbi:hypothetical protein Z959_08755 [Clostridium novyi B str. ATCC 27606]|uniref:Uncharacterized protein n=1 Tax=Clostridium novyi B str. ATCC 27606 TaxID=1443123 RepID=A0AA40IUQ8_CLONO|nr:hypothetical protein [Clostridium novyi]KEI15002.1 hypothetical protein Z958_07675 [Clostridium novyi B str. NCTC 9691]KEI16907.1 hypothetical protein Z959_08755 [Clostridium novyi B str. ATCC 27606]
MSKKIKFNFVIISMIILLIVISILSFKQNKILLQDKENLIKISSIQYFNNKGNYKKETCSYIIKQIQKYSCIKIKKVINNNYDKLITMNLEFHGEQERLDQFIEAMKVEKKLYDIKCIQLKLDNNKIYKGNITINFIV